MKACLATLSLLLLSSCVNHMALMQEQLSAIDAQHVNGEITEAQWRIRRQAVIDNEAMRQQRAANFAAGAAAMSSTMNQMSNQMATQTQLYQMQTQQNVQNSLMRQQMQQDAWNQQMQMNRTRYFNLQPTYGGGYSGTIY